MIVNKEQTTIAYRCPECGETVFSIIGIFSLSGDMIRLICKNCRGSVLTLQKGSEGKVRLSVPCIACPKPHSFTLSQNFIFSRTKDDPAICLPCPYTSVDICFIGETEKVKEAIDQSNEALMELMRDAGIADLAEIRGDEDEYENEEYDPMIEDIVSYVLSDLREAGAIHCNCEPGKGSYTYRFFKENLIVCCENCKTARELRMAGMSDANKFIETTELYLK